MLIIAMTLATLAPNAPTWTDADLLEVAATQCPTNRRPNVEILRELLKIERAAGIPDAARGLLLAAACRESGYRADPSGWQDGGRSRGMFQFMAWAKKSIRKHGGEGADVRLDWRASARFWAAHVVKQYKRVKRHCRTSRLRHRTWAAMRWASANATAVRHPKCAQRDLYGRCVNWVPRCARAGGRGETLHWKTLRGWHRRLSEQRTASAR